MSAIQKLKKDLRALVNPEKAVILPKFFKTGPGEYGEGDKFLGVVVPDCRKVSKRYYNQLTLDNMTTLLHSEWHEERQVALFMLVLRFELVDEPLKRRIYDIFLQNTKYINNWDLVDCNTPRIVGRYIFEHPALLGVLDKLAESDWLWDRRISILSTLYFIVEGNDPIPTLKIAKKLLPDNHELIQKASGWMLRELGKRIDEKMLIDFLRENYDVLPRTTLRYAIEKFNSRTKKRFLAGDFSQ